MKTKHVPGCSTRVSLKENETLYQISHKYTPTRHAYHAVFADGNDVSLRAYREEHFPCDGWLDEVELSFTRDQIFFRS